MSVERGKRLVTVIFPEAQATIKARLVNVDEVKDGETYLVDRTFNANVILKPVSDQPLPKGPWQVKR